jgi:hypothetical protein
MRFLLDTNILIPLGDSNVQLQPGLAKFVRLATSKLSEKLMTTRTKDLFPKPLKVALISIRPCFVEKILSGEKNWNSEEAGLLSQLMCW